MTDPGSAASAAVVVSDFGGELLGGSWVVLLLPHDGAAGAPRALTAPGPYLKYEPAAVPYDLVCFDAECRYGPTWLPNLAARAPSVAHQVMHRLPVAASPRPAPATHANVQRFIGSQRHWTEEEKIAARNLVAVVWVTADRPRLEEYRSAWCARLERLRIAPSLILDDEADRGTELPLRRG